MANMARNAPLIAAVAGFMALAAPAQADGIMEDPLPRFEDRLCPGIAGLEREYAEEMVFRIRANAATLGVPMADPETCEANVIVAFVEDGGAYLANLAAERGYLFNNLGLRDRAAVLSQAGPARAWTQVTQRTRDGHIVGTRQDNDDVPQAGAWQAHSRIYRPVRNDITYALVLFDRSAVDGLSLGQLADYATLRALATEIPPAGAAVAPSILTLFDSADARPPGLTEYDRAWLGQLYSGISGLPPSASAHDLADARLPED